MTDIFIETDADIRAASHITEITGNLTISRYAVIQDGILSLPNLQRIEGDLFVVMNGSFVAPNGNLTQLALDSLEFVEGNLDIRANDKLINLSLLKLREVKGHFEISNNGPLETGLQGWLDIYIRALEKVGGRLHASTRWGQYIYMDSLQEVGRNFPHSDGLSLSGQNLIDVQFPELKYTRNIDVNLTVINGLEFRKLEEVVGDIRLHGNSVLNWASFPLLKHADSIKIEENNTMQDLSIPSLEPRTDTRLYLINNLSFPTCRAEELLQTFRGYACGTRQDECGYLAVNSYSTLPIPYIYRKYPNAHNDGNGLIIETAPGSLSGEPTSSWSFDWISGLLARIKDMLMIFRR